MNAHPDTETLSAFLDGEASEVEEHVAACADCRRRLDALSQVQSAVAAPVPPPDEHHRDAAVAAAVDAAAQSTPVTRRRRWTLVAVAGGAAAAVLVGVLVTGVSTSHKSSTAALRKAGPVSSQLVRAGDLGDVDDAQALRAKIEPGLPAAVAPQAAAGAKAAQPDTGAGGGIIRGGPSTATATTERRALNAARAPSEAPRCDAAARTLQPGRAVLVYVATARWQGTAADVFGFSPEGVPATSSRPTPTRVYVLARSDCRLLVFQSYAP